MPFIHRRGPDGTQQDPATAAADLHAALAALERGGIPPKAEQRLAELRARGAPQGAGYEGDQTLFTSDLSINEFALVARTGLQPVSQVMGSSVYHVGWQGMPGSFFGMGRGASELGVLSQAWNSARSLALSRLQQEARLAGADAVVGVHIKWGAHDFAPNSVEMVAMGTAVRTAHAERTDPPVLTDLSGQDLWKLLQAGYRPVGVVGATTIFYVVPQWSTQRLTTSWLSGRSNQELPDFTQAVYSAREVAFGHLSAQAQTLGAHGIVGVSIDQSIGRREVDTGNDTKRIDLIVTLHVLGTAIVEVPDPGRDLDVRTTLDLRGAL
ncbi:MAG: heavy metal-binding protein [Actinobacteria bacterium]|nr:heavy metal-binding protein [Actinomycetota bacterium]